MASLPRCPLQAQAVAKVLPKSVVFASHPPTTPLVPRTFPLPEPIAVTGGMRRLTVSIIQSNVGGSMRDIMGSPTSGGANFSPG